MGNHVARPSRKALKALSKAGYAYRTTAGRTTVTGRIVKTRKYFLGLGYTSKRVVPLKRR